MKDALFVGRKKELEFLDSLYNSKKFEMLIVHGRRRVGKSYLLSHFASLHAENSVFFAADKSSEKNNVRNFCSSLDAVLHCGDYLKSFQTWNDVYSFFDKYESNKRLVLIIDEFTYLFSSDSAFDTRLQNAIDNIFRKKNIFLILCGSEVSVIEDIIDNSSKPLYGRKTAEIKLLPFDFKEASEFYPNYNPEQKLIAYSVLGGIPLYLSLFDDRLSIEENIIKNCLVPTGYLFNEVDTLLRMELKEIYFYREILYAIGAESSDFGDIKNKIDEDSAKIAKYLRVLIDLGLVKKEIPCGEKAKSRNTLYSICDNYFSFYFTFIYKYRSMLNGLISPQKFFENKITKETLMAFVGHRFENVCETYLKELFYNGKMHFFAENLGRWWGSNPVLKRAEEIDLVAYNEENVLICECKCTEQPFDEKELRNLQDSSLCFEGKTKWFMIFSKNGVSQGVSKIIADKPEYYIIDLNQLYQL